MKRRFRWDADRHELVEVGQHGQHGQVGLLVCPDLPGYQSPIDGRWIEGRAARREDLKRSGCREYDPSERRLAAEAQQKADAQLDRSVERTAERYFHETLDARGRERLVQELKAGAGTQYVRRRG